MKNWDIYNFLKIELEYVQEELLHKKKDQMLKNVVILNPVDQSFLNNPSCFRNISNDHGNRLMKQDWAFENEHLVNISKEILIIETVKKPSKKRLEYKM